MDEPLATTAGDTEEKMLLAMKAVQENGLKKKDAAEKFGVSLLLLKRRLTGGSPGQASGRPKFFTKADDEMLYQMLKRIQLLHQPFIKELFLETVRKLAEKKGNGDHNFASSWLYGFLKRHSDVTLRKKTAKDRIPRWNKQKCDSFIEVMSYLNREGYLADPRSIFALNSLEEVSPLPDRKKKPTVIPPRKKQKTGLDRGFSVIVCGSATGQPLRAMMLREGSVILEPWFANTKEEETIGENLTGVFDTKTFGAYIEHELIPFIQTLDPPVAKSVIFVDDRWLSSYDLYIMEIAIQNNLQIVPFPIANSDKIQPLDKTEFRLLTRIWLEFINERDRPLNEFVRTNTLARTLMASKRRQDMVTSIKEGFQNRGIFPFDQKKIRASVIAHIKTPLPPRPPTTIYDSFLKRIESYTLNLGTESGMPEDKLKRAMEAFRISIINSKLPLNSKLTPLPPVNLIPPADPPIATS